ncbi:MAG: HD domain-containing protein [Acutalibacteraceae bacterium]|nr:HD domain-containing protein [Acutalibacteraceae bacterium]
MENIILSDDVKTIITTLFSAGYKAYAVGGCVRDSLLKKTPYDWDICTNAMPEEIKEIFSKFKYFETGIKYGTITLIVNSITYEITTFRSEGSYNDSRHPKNVCFEKNIEIDLARRDFTINAIAFNQYDGIVDMFGGIEDIKNKIIRTVGDSNKRFSEDSLRILRALRFSSMLEFSIDSETKAGIFNNKQLLRNISVERIWNEFKKLLIGSNAVKILREYVDVISVFLPEIKNMVGFKQHSKYHCYDVWEHTLHALSCADNDITIKLTVLFHDIGKPNVFTIDEKGEGHFYGHPKVSAEITENILNRFKVDNKTKEEVITLVREHDRVINATEKSINRTIQKLGSNELFEKLLKVKLCDVAGQSEDLKSSRTKQLNSIKNKYKELIKNNKVVTKITDLKINGKDIMALGISEGKYVGEVLRILFTMVTDDNLPNNHIELIKKATKIITNYKY